MKLNKFVEKEKNDILEEIPVEEPVTKKTGRVKAEKLNVRKTADKNADILVVIDKNDEVVIEDEKDILFYHITTATGIDGYVMKEFIEV